MKNNFKKAFTLTELLAVIIIIGVVLLIALPNILGLINNESENISKTMEDIILKAGELYVQDNSDSFPEAEGNSYCITFEKLIEKNYLTDNLIDPISNEKINIDQFVKINVKYGNYEYKITDMCDSVEVVEDRPYIFVLKQTPSNTEYAQSKEIKVKYLSEKKENSHYYIKVSESVSINNVVSACGNDVLPNSCTSINTSILKPNVWYEVSDNTIFTINKNMTIHAIMKNDDNYSKGVVYKETKIDNTPPNVAIKLGTMYTDRVEVKAICTEDISGIVKYEFSNNGSTWVNTSKNNTYTFTGLTQGTSYSFTVRCTNGSGISEVESTIENTRDIVKPVIKQDSQLPTDQTTYPVYASERKIKITYSGTNVQNPEYYFKSTIDATVSNGVIISSCGTGTLPGTCNTSSVTTLVANTWYKTNNASPIITYKKDGALYAMTKDPSDNKASATTFNIVNMDLTPPECRLSFTNIKTDRVALNAICTEDISGIVKYEYSKDNGATWIDNGTTANYMFTGLTQGTSYPFAIRVTNGAALKNTIIISKILPTIVAPNIEQISQVPDKNIYPTYAQKRVIKITYTGTNVQNPGYYFKSTIDAKVDSGVITHSCGNDTLPGECSSTSVTTLSANMWYKSNTVTPSITYTQNGALYAVTIDPSLNTALATTYNVVNMDITSPITNLEVTDIKTDRATLIATCSDDISKITKYEFSKDNGTTWVSYNSSDSSYTHTFTNLTQGISYTFKVRCTNGAALTNTVNTTDTIPLIQDVKIEQASETKTAGYDYATKRVIKITYSGANVQNPGYYFKSDVKATVPSGVITHNCKTGTVPNTSSCTTSSVTTLEPDIWYKTSSTTPNITYDNNGSLYAITIDPSNNQSTTATYTISKVDSTVPTVSMEISNIKTDRATIKATCSDTESGITKYQYSKDNGSTWIDNGTTASYTFTGLSQGSSYTFAIKCTNGSALTKTSSLSKTIATITAPAIVQISQVPTKSDEFPTYAQSRTIRITYYPDNIESPKYYYSEDGINWTQLTSGTTIDFTYSTTGTLYAKTVDPSGNVATSSTYTIANIDTEPPKITVSVSGKTVTLSLSDTIGVTGYTVNQSSSSVDSWTNITSTKNTTQTWTASKAGTFYGWVKDDSGRTSSAVINIPESAFAYAATPVEYDATAYCNDGATLDSNGDCVYSNNESKCGCKTYKSCENSSCGAKTCTNAACGYNSCAVEACGCNNYKCTLWKECYKFTCTCYSIPDIYTDTFNQTNYQGFESSCSINCEGTSSHSYGRYQGCGGTEEKTGSICNNANSKVCIEYNSCENSSCGAKTCTNAACGYNSCRNSSCGCETANSCSATVQKAYKCKDTSHTLSGNTCTEYTCPDGGTLNTKTNICEF